MVKKTDSQLVEDSQVFYEKTCMYPEALKRITKWYTKERNYGDLHYRESPTVYLIYEDETEDYTIEYRMFDRILKQRRRYWNRINNK